MTLQPLMETPAPPDLSGGRIRLLPEALINRIAAGEVIERPASVVKELVENALDAGATRIDLTLSSRDGWSIAVADDGEGMAPGDLTRAFQRHATSKIQSLDDLDRLDTLGFRGEALPSIAAVSRVVARSARRGTVEGAEVCLEGGRIESSVPCAPRPGTTIEVHDLFSHTPARKKFLKSVSTELSHICAVLGQHALSRPAVAFSATHEGRPLLEYSAARTLADRIAQIYGLPLVEERAVPFGLRRGTLDVSGWCSRPGMTRATRQGQEWFVNGRAVRHPLLLRAVDQAYATRLMVGRHPVVLAFLTLPPSDVDVNVHPAKRDVRFARPDDVYRAVLEALAEALNRSERPDPPDGQPRAYASGGVSAQRDRVKEAIEVYQVSTRPQPPPSGLALAPMVRFLGQFDHTYLLAEVDGVLRIIDQHAAHERVLYEKLIADYTESRSLAQPLLIPETCEYPPHQAIAIAERLDLLRSVGVELEPFGPSTFVIRAVPAAVAVSDWSTIVWAMVDALLEEEAVESPEPPLRLLATVACHAAVKAHQRLDGDAMIALVRELAATPRNATCPHGRPTALTWAPSDLERAFGRRG